MLKTVVVVRVIELCFSLPTSTLQGKLMLSEDADFGKEMSHVRGAVVVKRPSLAKRPGALRPANSLNYVETLRSYFPVFKEYLLPR